MFEHGRALGDFLAVELGTPEQVAGNWDLRNFRARASDAQLVALAERWDGLVAIGGEGDE